MIFDVTLEIKLEIELNYTLIFIDMTEEQRINILIKAKDFFREEIVTSHIEKACKRASKLSEYNINPFLFKYLANFLTGKSDAESIATALVLPRILGSAITTSFGMKIQKLISLLFEGLGSTTSGIDIEFIDSIDNRQKYCQLKAGPNTINHDDVTTVFGHFRGVRNLARTNNLNIGINDMIVGVIYGDESELSSHYKNIATQYPVIIGKDFWHRLTGKEDFYFDLINAFGEIALEIDGRHIVRNTIAALTIEVQQKYFD